MSIYTLTVRMKKALIRHRGDGRDVYCDICRKPLEVGEEIRKFQRRKELYHAACYKKWDKPVDLPIMETRSPFRYFCGKCKKIVGCKILRRGSVVFKCVCIECGELLIGPRVAAAPNANIGTCVNCGKPKMMGTLKINEYHLGFQVCDHKCASAYGRKQREQTERQEKELTV